jgi:hypothetical protein
MKAGHRRRRPARPAASRTTDPVTTPPPGYDRGRSPSPWSIAPRVSSAIRGLPLGPPSESDGRHHSTPRPLLSRMEGSSAPAGARECSSPAKAKAGQGKEPAPLVASRFITAAGAFVSLLGRALTSRSHRRTTQAGCVGRPAAGGSCPGGWKSRAWPRRCPAYRCRCCGDLCCARSAAARAGRDGVREEVRCSSPVGRLAADERHEPRPALAFRMPVRVVVRGAGLREIRHPPRSLAEQVFNIQRWTEMARGGLRIAWGGASARSPRVMALVGCASADRPAGSVRCAIGRRLP